MLINELFENSKRQLTEDQSKELDAFFESLTFEERISFISEVAILSELNPFEIGARKTSHTPKPGDETGKDVSVVGSGIEKIASGGSAAANVAAGRAAAQTLRQKALKPRADKMARKFINQPGSGAIGQTPRDVKKQLKVQTKAIAMDAARNPDPDNKSRISNKNVKAGAKQAAQRAAQEKIDAHNKANPGNKISDKKAGKMIKKAGKLASRIAARHAAATLMGGGVLSIATNLAALGWDAYDIWQWYKKNKHNNIKAI